MSGRQPATSIPLPMRIAPIVAWWDAAEDYVQLTTADVDQWVDRIGGQVFAQTTTSQKPQWSTTSFGLGVPGITFDATDDILTGTTIAKSVTNFMHEGPCTVVYLYESSATTDSAQTWIRTCNINATNLGVHHRLEGAQAAIDVYCYDGASPAAYAYTTATSVVQLDGAARWVAMAHNTTSYNAFGSGNNAQGESAMGDTLGSGDSTTELRIGSGAGGAEATFADVLLYQGYLSQAKCNELGAYFAKTKGVVA